MRGIKGERYKALGRKLLRIEPGGLFLDAAARVHDYDGRVLLAFVEAFREVDVAGQGDVVVLEFDGLDGDFAALDAGHRARSGTLP